MNIYSMSEENIEKYALEFNNTSYGKRIWIFSMIPQVISFLAIFIYLIMMIYGMNNPEINEVIGSYIIADIIALTISLIAYGIVKMMYWKQVMAYVSELNKIELAKKEVSVKVKKVSDKVKKDVKKKVANTKKVIKNKK